MGIRRLFLTVASRRKKPKAMFRGYWRVRNSPQLFKAVQPVIYMQMRADRTVFRFQGPSPLEFRSQGPWCSRVVPLKLPRVHVRRHPIAQHPRKFFFFSIPLSALFILSYPQTLVPCNNSAES